MNSMDETLKRSAASTFVGHPREQNETPAPDEPKTHRPRFCHTHLPGRYHVRPLVDPIEVAAYASTLEKPPHGELILTDQATVTVGVIAKELGVSDAKVKKAIETLKIEPVGKRGVCKLYAADAVDAVRTSLS